MNKNVIIALVVGAVLVLGGVGYYLYSSNDNGTDSQTSTSTEEATSLVNPYDSPVIVTGTISDSAEPDGDGTITMQYKSEELWSTTIETTEGSTEIIFAGDYTYMLNPDAGSWLRLPSDEDVSSPADEFKLTDEEITEFNESAVAQGTTDCSLGTCEIWEWTDPTDPENTATLIVSSDGRIVEATAITGTTKIVMTYDYTTPVSIEVPTDFIDFGDLQ